MPCFKTSAAELSYHFHSWQETIYLLRSPANARRLMEAVARDRSGRPVIVKTMEELEAQAGE
jgi:antitoxin YefM